MQEDRRPPVLQLLLPTPAVRHDLVPRVMAACFWAAWAANRSLVTTRVDAPAFAPAQLLKLSSEPVGHCGHEFGGAPELLRDGLSDLDGICLLLDRSCAQR